MAQIIVRNLEEAVRDRLRALAARHGRSMEEEVRLILRAAVAAGGRAEQPVGRRIAARFAKVGFESEIDELRGTPAMPAAWRRWSAST
ncbi:MAG: FitA-like ribbon-helix-helix domain-containing protein, partial [Phycisphaerales bacterium]